jgi:hypothetical protein
MSEITLVLTRTPVSDFTITIKDVLRSGRWGTLALIRGPKITSVSFVDGASNAAQSIPFADRTLGLVTADSTPLELCKEYTSMERFHVDDYVKKHRKGYFVQLHPRSKAYPIRFEPKNRAVKDLRPGHSGDCIRIGDTDPGAEEGILIHEAPHVGWLTGCISPRPKGDRTLIMPNEDGNPSFRSIKEIMDEIKVHAAGTGWLFVMDW